ncbi:MAG: hypothetical protein JNL70_11775 [Saprospiraceae bacterium]|nr:hypothetical protein [Saprospiraceae bacterium]
MTTKSSTKANQRAENTARLIEKGKALLQKRNQTRALVSATENIMKGEPVSLYCGMFILSILIELGVSWSIYREISSHNAPKWEGILTPALALFIVLWAALNAHLLSKKMKKSLFQLELARLQKSGIGYDEAFEMISEKAERDYYIGIFSSAVLLSLVVFMSHYRIQLLEDIGKGSFNLGDLILPAFFVGLEILTGFFVGFFLFKTISNIKARKNDKALQKCKVQCSQEAKMTLYFYDETIEKGEKFTPSKNLEDVLFRWKNISIEREDYFEPISSYPTLNGVDKKQLNYDVEEN